MLPLSTYTTLDPKLKKIFDEISFRAVNGKIEPFVVDEQNRRIGILTSSPKYSLDVNGDMSVSGPALFEEINVQDLKAQSLGVSQHLIAGQATIGNVITNRLYNAEWGWQPYTPTFTGFSANPTGFTSRYVKMGKLVIWSYSPGTQGTSNAITFTMSIPVTGASFTQTPTMSRVKDNSTWLNSTGLMAIGIANFNTLTIYKTLDGSAFTGSGGKDVSFVILYEAA